LTSAFVAVIPPSPYFPPNPAGCCGSSAIYLTSVCHGEAWVSKYATIINNIVIEAEAVFHKRL
jgi:hypothetical protein